MFLQNNYANLLILFDTDKYLTENYIIKTKKSAEAVNCCFRTFALSIVQEITYNIFTLDFGDVFIRF